MARGDGFTADIVARLCEVDGVYGVHLSSWPGVPPLLLTSYRVDRARIFEVITEHWRSQSQPIVRAVGYDDSAVRLEDRLACAYEVVDRVSADGVRVDVAYPVSEYGRIYLEVAHDPDHMSAQPARILRQECAVVAPGDWPMEVRDRPWYDSSWSLDSPPLGWRAAHPVLGRAPSWVEVALQRVYDSLASVAGVPDVQWSDDSGHSGGRIHGSWTDGPLLRDIDGVLGLRRTDGGYEAEVDENTIPVILTRGLTPGFQLAAIETLPDLLTEDFPFIVIRDSVSAASVDPALVEAWKAVVKAHPLRNIFDKDVLRAYLARHRDEAAQRRSSKS